MFRECAEPLRPLHERRIAGQHDVAQELAVVVEQREAQEPFPAVVGPAGQQLLEIARRRGRERQLQRAGRTGLQNFLDEAVVSDAAAVGERVVVRDVEHRPVGLGYIAPQDFLLARLGQQRVVQAVAEDEAGQAEEFDVGAPLLHEPRVAERAGRRVAGHDQHRVVRQHFQDRFHVTHREVAAGAVVRRPVHPDGQRNETRACQHRDPVDAVRAAGLRAFGPRSSEPRRPRRQPLQDERRSDRQPQRDEAVAHQRVGTENGDAVKIELELQHQQQRHAVAQEHQQSRYGLGDSPAAQQDEESQAGEEEARRRHLPEDLRAEPAQEREAVAPSGDGIDVGVGVAAPADVMPERFPIRDRAVEADERLLPGAHHHPRIRQAGGGHGHREQQRKCAPQPLAGRQRRQQQAGQRQHHQRPVVRQTQPIRGRRGDPEPRSGRVSDAVQEQRVGHEEQQRVERIDLGDDRLRPDVLRRAEQPRRGQCRQLRGAEQTGACVHRAARERPEHGAGQVAEHRGAVEGKLHEQMTEQRIERIARRMRDAELRPGHQKQAVVFQHDGAR